MHCPAGEVRGCLVEDRLRNVIADHVRDNSVEFQVVDPRCEPLAALGELCNSLVQVEPCDRAEADGVDALVVDEEREDQRVVRVETEDAGEVREDLAVGCKRVGMSGHGSAPLHEYGVYVVNPVFGPALPVAPCHGTTAPEAC